MKTTTYKYISIFGILLFIIACSTKKNTWVNRNMHALSAKDNILYNGNIALDKGIKDLKEQYKDSYWETLPIERLMVIEDPGLTDEPKANPNFEVAETKAIKAIQKHSMNIDGEEKNPQMDEAHLLLGKARYYQQRFVPALEAFNYVLYKYPSSDKIYEARIWREKTNIRLDNDALAVTNLNRLLKEIKFKDQIFADANAGLSQAFLNLEEKDSAVAKLKLAKEFTKHDEEKARYDFILGQLYQELGYKDSAIASYESVIKMNRKSPREYIIQAYIKKAQMFDYETGDIAAFEKKYEELVADRENRPYLDAIYYQMGVFYTKLNKQGTALSYYRSTLQEKSQDQYLVASTYRNMGEIYFDKANYIYAGMYYDSTLVNLNPRTREFISIKKKRENLDDVIKYEGIAAINDSIIHIYSLPESQKIAYYESYIEDLKIKNQQELELKNKKAINSQNNEGSGINPNDFGSSSPMSPPTSNVASGGSNVSNFYFYNPQTVAFGRNQFLKNWGNRELKDNWRLSAISKPLNSPEQDPEVSTITVSENPIVEADNELYHPEFYINQLPKSQVEIDALIRERNFANYQLGIIYKEKFKEYELSATKFELLLKSNPEERLVLPSMYNLYKIYLIIDNDKAIAMKNEIISKFPDSRYAQILSNSDSSNPILNETPIANYEKLYKLYSEGDYKKVLIDVEVSLDQYAGDELISKFELLKANTIGKVEGLAEYKKALNFVALNYPNSEEGKLAESIYTNDIPKLEQLNFYDAKPTSWKIVYLTNNLEDKNTKILLEKLNKFIKDRSPSKLKLSIDIYTMKDYFIVLHGMSSEAYAKNVVSVLKEYKEYKVTNTAYVISNDNYKIVQIKKNFDEYLKTPPSDPKPPKPVEVELVKPNKAAPVSPQNGQNSATKKSEFNAMPPQSPDGEDDSPNQAQPINPTLKSGTTKTNRSTQTIQSVQPLPKR